MNGKGFSPQWARTHAQDRQGMSARRLKIEYHFFPLEELVAGLKALWPAPRLIRYKTHWAYPRQFDRDTFETTGDFSTYFSTDLLVVKGSGDQLLPVLDDADRSLLERVSHRLLPEKSYLAGVYP